MEKDTARLDVEKRSDGVWILRIANEAKRNAVGPKLLSTLPEVCKEADAAEVRCLILTGASAGRAFSAGYDLQVLTRARLQPVLPDELLQEALLALERVRAPVIAAVEGPAYGAGAELAVACDLRIAGAGAVFSMPPAKLGIVYAPEGLARFTALLGPSRTKRLFFLAEAVDAEEALEIGLVDRRVDEGGALDAALEWAERIARHAPLAVQGMKRIFHLASRLSLPQAALAEVEELRRVSFASEDAKEGIAAALERRYPSFTGR